jgi:polyphosphate kinase 2
MASKKQPLFTEAQLKLLDSSRGIRYLMDAKKPNFKAVVKRLEFQRKLVRLQAELIKAQQWVIDNEARVLILVEGREFAGKGAAVRMFTEHLIPQHVRTVALEKPTKKERNQWYFKRYIAHLPETGEMVFYDRSWYNRALVEPVNGFCTVQEYKRFMNEVNHFERMLAEDGILIVKIFFSISRKEQAKRIEVIASDPLKSWQLTKVDLAAVQLYDKYSEYKKTMFALTDTIELPWTDINADDLDGAFVKAFRVVLNSIPYK